MHLRCHDLIHAVPRRSYRWPRLNTQRESLEQIHQRLRQQPAEGTPIGCHTRERCPVHTRTRINTIRDRDLIGVIRPDIRCLELSPLEHSQRRRQHITNERPLQISQVQTGPRSEHRI
jgi:hypothetical protein